MKYKLKVYSIWEYGKRTDANGNPHQEDWTFPQVSQESENDRLFVLCDGMGGHDAGEVASSTVCEAMGKSILESSPNPEGEFNDDMLKKAISDAFDALDIKDTGAAKKMGTTMAMLKLHSNGATIAHMGDSRVYHIRPGKDAESTQILFMTSDHSLVNDLIKVGELTVEQARNSRQKNVITRALQPNLERRPRADIHHIYDIKPGDYFYLCSDGMLENMEDPQICYNFSDAAGTDEEKVKRLILATAENRDNHTAFIVHVIDIIDPIISAGKIDDNVIKPSNNQTATLNQLKSMAKKNKSMWLTFAITALIAIIVGFLGLKMCNNEDKQIDSTDVTTQEPDSLSSSEEDALYKEYIKSFPGKDNSYKEETGETLAEGEVDKETLAASKKDSISDNVEKPEGTNQPEDDENTDVDETQPTPQTGDQ